MAKEKIERRKQEIRGRKNFLPSLVITILLWGMVVAIVILTNPAGLLSVIIFFLFLLFALIFTLSIILGNTRRGILYSLSIILFLIMRLFGIGNALNFLFLFGISISLDLYFARL